MARTEKFSAECSGGNCTAVIEGTGIDEFVAGLVGHAKDVHGVEDAEELDRIAAEGRTGAQQAAGG